jgi:hypothetical protein
MTVYTNVFGGSNIYPSDVSYEAVTLTADQTYFWPVESAPGQNLIASIVDVTPSAGPFAIILPDATQASTGQTILFNNVGANAFVVKDADGVQVLSAAAGTTWQIYLTDNTTEAGTWRAFQYGASVSSANASALAGTGLIAIGTVLSQAYPVETFNSNYTAGISDRSKTYVWTGGAGTLALTAASTLSNNWFIQLRNEGTGSLTVDPSGSETINGIATLDFQPGDSALIVTDGTSFYTIGYGQAPVFAFDYTSIDVAGTGDYTLSGAELNRIAYNFTGVLTGNRNIIVPATVQQYWASNATSGSFALIVKTASGTGVNVAQGARTICYCDGTNVVLADTSGVSVPIQISEGGTGATTASAARINLGGTATGIAVFTAANQGAAQVALGLNPIEGGTY